MQYRKNIVKHFYEWIKVKAYLDRRARKPAVHEGEIWWASVGENVGVELINFVICTHLDKNNYAPSLIAGGAGNPEQ